MFCIAPDKAIILIIFAHKHILLILIGIASLGEAIPVSSHKIRFGAKIIFLIPSLPEVLGPVVQGIVSLTSSLVVRMLTVLVSTISNSHVFLLKKMWVATPGFEINSSK